MQNWIKPGAEVALVYDRPQECYAVRTATITKVKKSWFEISGTDDEFSTVTGRMKPPKGWRGVSAWRVIPLTDPEYPAYVRADKIRAARNAAAHAVDFARAGYFVDRKAIENAAEELARLAELMASAEGGHRG